MKLSGRQQQEIETRIRELGYELPVLIDELTDHICTAVEVEMEQGTDFEEAMRQIFGELNSEHTEALQSNVIGALLKDRSIRKTLQRHSMLLALLLSAWVFVEFLAWKLFGVAELGPVYGLLSAVIIGGVLWVHVRNVKTITGGVIYPKYVVKSGTQLSFISGCLFLLFLVFFFGYVDQEFYRAFQMQTQEEVTIEVLLYSSLAGMFAGVFATGLLLSGIYSFFLLMRKKSAPSAMSA